MAHQYVMVRRFFSELKISRYIPKRKSFYFVTLITEKFDSQTLCLPAKGYLSVVWRLWLT
jgi:hypothetical protein